MDVAAFRRPHAIRSFGAGPGVEAKSGCCRRRKLMSAFMPEVASTQAAQTDGIYFALLALSAIIILLVTALILVFSIRYRRGSKAERGAMPQVMSREFEVGWTSATLFLAVFIFWWVSSTQLSALVAPND